ncbi:helix-turn-helix domain-containing protein [Halobium salinum]|uniref:Helix-turn-helix domain-containing protein n=1 Tax=Halobium salinum TaxID=1364940 RepID=A0ABD5PC60_9EURY|nr:helix-turn-helix domain-containing protein [Halobium salinum]
MGSGIYVQVAVGDADSCPVADLRCEAEVESVSTDRRSEDAGGGLVGEVTLGRSDGTSPVFDSSRTSDSSPTADSNRASDPDQASNPDQASDFEPVFEDGGRTVYRFTADGECPCGRIPDHGCPVRGLRTESDELVVSFVAPDVSVVRSVVEDLRSHCGAVRIRRLTRSTPDGGGELVVVDRTAFTDRQYEVLRTAHEMGYFAQPKEARSAEVAAALDVSVSTFSEHLSVAQGKLLDQLLAGQ